MTNISAHGLWVFVAGREHYVAFSENPWFRKATIDQILHVELFHGHHLHWPDLDVDLEVEALEQPEKYPLVAR